MAELSESERQEVLASPQLQLTLALSAALAGAGAAPAWTAPQLPAALESACTRALPQRQPRLWWQPALAWRWAAVAVLLLAAAGFGLYYMLGQPASRGLLTPTGIAWAASEGTLLEGQLKFADYFSGTAEDSPEHPLWQLDRAVQDWSKASGVQASLTLERYERDYENDQQGYQATVQITLPAARPEQVEELRERLAGYAWKDGLKSYSQQYYMSERWPETHYPGRKFVINGVEADYPQDFTKDELDSLKWFMNVMPSDQGHTYMAFLKLGDGTRFPLADVVRIRFGETIHIEDYAQHFDRSRLTMPSFVDGESVYVPAKETGLEFDPLELLERMAKSSSSSYKNERSYWMNARGVRFVIDLIPPEHWPAVDAGRWTAVRQSDLEAAEQLSRKLEAAVAEWSSAYPELQPGGVSAFLLERGLVKRAETPVQWQVTFWYYEGSAMRGLRQALADCGVPIREWPMQPTAEKLAAASTSQSRAQAARPPGWQLVYELIDVTDEHGSDYYGAITRTTPAEKERVNRLASELRNVYEDWLAEVQQSLPELTAECYDAKQYDVCAHLSVFIGSRDKQLVDELKRRLAAAGAPEPKAFETSGNENKPRGMSLEFYWFSIDELRGITAAGTAHLDRHYYEKAEEFSQRAQQAVTDWQAQQAEAEDYINYAASRKFGELPVVFSIGTDQAPGTALDELRLFMENKLGLKAEVETSVSYNAGPKDQVPPQAYIAADWEKSLTELMTYELLPDRAFDGVPFARWPQLITAQELEQIKQTVSAMQAALDVWNREQEADTESGGARASLEVRNTGVIPYSISIYCTRLDEDALHELAGLLEAAGAPTYRYGNGYMNRGSQTPKIVIYSQRESTYWFYNLLPQVETMGLGVDEIRQRIPQSKLDEARENAERMLQVFNEWIGKHPNLGTPSTTFFSGLDDCAQFRVSGPEDVITQVQIYIYWDDKEQRQKLVDELVGMIKEQTGREPEQFYSTRRNSGSMPSIIGQSIRNSAKHKRGTSWAYALIPQVECAGLNAAEMKARIAPAKIKRAKKLTAELKNLVKEWLADHPELDDPEIGDIFTSANVVEFGEVYPTGSVWGDESMMIPMRANFAIWWNDDSTRKKLVDELCALIAKSTDLSEPDEIRDALTR